MDDQFNIDADLDSSGGSTAGAKPTKDANWGLRLRLALGLLIAAAFLTFVFQNTDSTEVSFLGWGGSLPLSVLMIVCGVAGVLIWALAGTLSRRRSSDA